MNIEQVKYLIQNKSVDDIIDVFAHFKLVKCIEEAIKAYNVKTHEVFDKAKRQDKLKEDGKLVKVNRIGLSYQNKIVRTQVAFLGVPSYSSSPADASEEAVVSIIDQIHDDNKLDNKFKKFVEFALSEKESAELWYIKDGEAYEGAKAPVNYRCTILSRSKGDILYPIFDSTGDLIAFGREYTTDNVIEGEIVKKAVFELYTAELIYISEKIEEREWITKSAKNNFGKIPVIYSGLDKSAFEDVQHLIERLENKASNHSDTNDYFDSPIILAKGQVLKGSDKAETGKMLELENQGDAKYLTWDNAPESMKMEIDNLINFIHMFTSTPDISFENLKGIGQFSGVALKFFFMDAHMKASENEAIFGEAVQRRLNLLKHAIVKHNTNLSTAKKLKIYPTFKYFLPENPIEDINVLGTAIGYGIISTDTAIYNNPLLTDPANEADKIKLETIEKEKRLQQKSNVTPPTE